MKKAVLVVKIKVEMKSSYLVFFKKWVSQKKAALCLLLRCERIPHFPESFFWP